MTASFLFDGGFQWMTIASVIMLASGTIAHLFFSKSAVWRYQIWLNVLIAIFLLPLITLFIRSMDWSWTPTWNLTVQTLTTQDTPDTPPTSNDPIPEFRPELKASTTQNSIRETDTPPTTSITQSSPYSQNESFQQEWMQTGKTVLLWIWSLGSLFALAKWIFGLRKIDRILQIAEPATNEMILDTLHRTTDGIQMNRTPTVRFSDQITTPMVVGTWNPSILLPTKQSQQVTASELEQILIHECAHIQRGDHRIWFLQQIGKVLLWINPLYHWLQTELNRAREELCDNHVLQQWTGLDYAQTLSKVSNRWHPHDPMITGLAIGFRKHQLLHRVETLLDPTADHRSSLNPISQSASGILFSALILSCALVTAGLTQEQTKNSFDDAREDSTIETSDLRPYPNEIKPQKYLMSDGKDIHEVEYYPWVEESDYQRVPKSLLEIRQIPTFAWPSSKQPRIQVSGRFARNLGLTYKQVTDLNTATTQAIHDYNMLKAHHLKFTYHSKKEKNHNGATTVENVNFEWYPKKTGLINSFREMRKRLETQVESILGPERAAFFWKNDKNPSILSHLSDGALSENPDKKPYPNSFIFALQRFDSGLIITLISGKIAGFNSGMVPEELDIYLPEEMKSILAEWRQRVKNEPPAPEKIQELWDRSENNSEEIYPQPEEHDGVIWHEHANYMDISKTQLTLLEQPGLSIYNGISHIAATMLGLSDDDNRLLMKTYQEFDTRFRTLQKQHMHPLSNESYNLLIDAFPNEANKLKEEWLTFLLKTFGETQAHTIDKALRAAPDEYEYMRGFPRSIFSFMSFPSRIWLESGNDSIEIYVLDERTNFKRIEWAKSDGQQGVTVALKNYISDHQERILRSLFNLDFDSE